MTPPVLEPPLVMPAPSPQKPTATPTQSEARPSQETPWRDIDLYSFKYPETPFKRVREEITNLQNQYFRLEHITHGVSRALDNCGLKNILWELAKKTDPLKVDALETEKAQLAAQVATMTPELAQKSEEIRRYKAEQTIVMNRVQDLVGNPGEVVNKVHLYDKLMETAEFSSSQPTLQILVKYSRSMKDVLKEIQIFLPLREPHNGHMVQLRPDRLQPKFTKLQVKLSSSQPPRLRPDPAKPHGHQSNMNPLKIQKGESPQFQINLIFSSSDEEYGFHVKGRMRPTTSSG